LQTQNWVFVLFGCAAAAVLALAVDQLLALIEIGVRVRSRLRAALGSAGIAALVAATLVPSLARSPSSYIVGAKTFAEQYVLSALIAQRLRAAGLSATSREGLGSNVIYEALVSGDIDVYVDYSGTLWANQFHHSEIKPRQELLTELKTALAQQNVTLLGELGFENAYALVMPKKHRPCRWRPTTNSSRGRNGPDCRRLTGSIFAHSGRCSRTSCMPRPPPARST
jgi:osmoprotectant transport system permease protein